jgi:hypothetical protein
MINGVLYHPSVRGRISIQPARQRRHTDSLAGCSAVPPVARGGLGGSAPLDLFSVLNTIKTRPWMTTQVKGWLLCSGSGSASFMCVPPCAPACSSIRMVVCAMQLGQPARHIWNPSCDGLMLKSCADDPRDGYPICATSLNGPFNAWGICYRKSETKS